MRINGRFAGERTAIRSYRKSDLDFVSGMWFDRENGRYLSAPEEKYIDEKFQRAVDEMEDSPLGYYFVAERIDTGELVGSCCAFPDYDNEDNLVFDIGYCVHKSCWRQGYGSEIVTVLLDWIGSKGGKTVTAEAAKENIASCEMLKKLGFEIVKESSFKKYNRPPRKLPKHRLTCPFAVMLCPFSLKYIQYSCGKWTSPDSKIAASYGTSPVSEEV